MNKLTEHSSTVTLGRHPSIQDSYLGDASLPHASHKISALYPTRAEAEGVRSTLIEYGFAPRQIEVLQEHSQLLTAEGMTEGGSDGVLKDVLVDGAIGTAVGTGVGALGTVMMMAANVTLFVAAPLIAPLTMLGWFASIGGVIGGAVGAGKKGTFSELVSDAIKAGNTLILVRTYTEAETQRAKAIINDSLKGRDEVVMETD